MTMPKPWSFPSNAKRFSRTLFALSNDIKKDHRVATWKVASMILADAKRFAPHRTGALKRSGRIEMYNGMVSIAFGGRGTGVDYAPFVEFGRAPGRAPPLMEMETWAARATGDAGNAWALAQAIARRGVQPKPFLRPAVQKNRKAIIKIYGKHFNKSWTKAVHRST